MTRVRIIYECTHCARTGLVRVPWSRHHSLPKGWKSRDAAPTYTLARRTNHVFACSPSCAEALNRKYPPPKKPRWFRYA